MKKKVMMGCLFMSVLLLGACQKSNTDTTAKSTKQTNSIVKNLVVVLQRTIFLVWINRILI